MSEKQFPQQTDKTTSSKTVQMLDIIGPTQSSAEANAEGSKGRVSKDILCHGY